MFPEKQIGDNSLIRHTRLTAGLPAKRTVFSDSKNPTRQITGVFVWPVFAQSQKVLFVRSEQQGTQCAACLRAVLLAASGPKPLSDPVLPLTLTLSSGERGEGMRFAPCTAGC